MTVAKKTISRRWGEPNASKMWPYVTSYSMARVMRTVANTGISLEKAIQALNRVVLDRLVKPHPGSRLTTALSKADFVAVAKDSEREEVTAEEAQEQGYVFDSHGFLFTVPLAETRVKSEDHDGGMNASTPVAGHKRRFSSTFSPAPYFTGYVKQITLEVLRKLASDPRCDLGAPRPSGNPPQPYTAQPWYKDWMYP